jgi:hypothetical protein
MDKNSRTFPFHPLGRIIITYHHSTHVVTTCGGECS